MTDNNNIKPLMHYFVANFKLGHCLNFNLRPLIYRYYRFLKLTVSQGSLISIGSALSMFTGKSWMTSLELRFILCLGHLRCQKHCCKVWFQLRQITL